jgi:hypothetical protein
MGADRSPSRGPTVQTGNGLTVPRLEANVRTAYAIELLRWCLITGALETAFFETYGMTASQNAFGLLTYSATNTLVELPSGWLADTIGRKKILVASALLWGLGYMTHCFGSFYWVIVGECVIALGVSAGSGSDEALIYETVRELMRLRNGASKGSGKAKDPDEEEVGKEVTKVLANMGFCRNISSFSGVLLGGVVLRACALASPSLSPPSCVSRSDARMLTSRLHACLPQTSHRAATSPTCGSRRVSSTCSWRFSTARSPTRTWKWAAWRPRWSGPARRRKGCASQPHSCRLRGPTAKQSLTTCCCCCCAWPQERTKAEEEAQQAEIDKASSLGGAWDAVCEFCARVWQRPTLL